MLLRSKTATASPGVRVGAQWSDRYALFFQLADLEYGEPLAALRCSETLNQGGNESLASRA